MGELREPVRSFLDAQKKRQEAFDNGDYELNEDEGFKCNNCGFRGLWGRMIDPSSIDIPIQESQDIVKCPDCGSTDEFSSGNVTVEFYQRFGYEFSEFPRNIPRGQEEEFRL